MFLLGFSGGMLSGKDTAYNIIQNILQPRLVVKIAFADALKEEVACATRTTVQYINEHKTNFRLIMQGWGTDFRRELCNKNYWIEEWLKRTKKVPKDTYAIVATDVRFKNEAEVIRSCGGYTFRIKRNTGVESTHPSEVELTDFNYPYHDYVDNNSTLDKYKVEIKQLIARFGIIKPIV